MGILREALRALSKAPNRGVATSGAKTAPMVVLDQKLKDHYYPHLGTREIVGHGPDGHPFFDERSDEPFPAVRFKEENPEIAQKRKKATGMPSLSQKRKSYTDSTSVRPSRRWMHP